MVKPSQQSPDFPDCFYRVSVKGVYVKDGKLMFAKDSSGSAIPGRDWDWDLPGGGLDFGETFEQALTREIQEEMNLTVSAVSKKPIYLWTENHGPGRGIDWYWVCVLAFIVEIKDLQAFTPTQECTEIRFFSKADLAANKADLAPQMYPLVDLFNPKDFDN